MNAAAVRQADGSVLLTFPDGRVAPLGSYDAATLAMIEQHAPAEHAEYQAGIAAAAAVVFVRYSDADGWTCGGYSSSLAGARAEAKRLARFPHEVVAVAS